MHMMLFHIIYLYRTEGSQTYMQGYMGNIHTFRFDGFQKFRSKMQSGCRCRCGTEFLGVNRLVTLLVFQFFVDVRRKRHLSDFFQCSVKVSLAGKLHDAVSVRLYFYHFADQSSAAKGKLHADLCFFSGTANDFPELLPFLLQEQKFNKGTVIYFLSIQTCRQNTGVIHDKQITRLQTGNIQSYLGYILITLVVALMAVRLL